MSFTTTFDNTSSTDIPYDQIFEDYLIYSEDPDPISDSTSDPISKGSTQVGSIMDNVNKSINSINMNTDDLDVPMRSPARLIGKKPDVNIGQMTPNSPDISDSSSLDYNSSYGSDRSSQASIFSDISDRGQFGHEDDTHQGTNKIDQIDEHPIDLDNSDYEEILELLDYMNIDEHDTLKLVDSVVTIKAHYNPEEVNKNPLRLVKIGSK